MSIILKNVSKKYGSLTVFENFSAEFKENTVTCILGKSGSGKTTLLNIISGITDYEGSVSGTEKGVSYIFQKERLLKNLTVSGNIDYVLKSKMPSAKEREGVINPMLETVGLLGFKNSYPGQLSGGMQQRVSMARAFAYPSGAILMDEPFRSLDIALKYRLEGAFLSLWEKDRRTSVIVTHDIDEALTLADRIYILEGSPAEVTHTFEIPNGANGRDLSGSFFSSLRNEIYGIMLKL